MRSMAGFKPDGMGDYLPRAQVQSPDSLLRALWLWIDAWFHPDPAGPQDPDQDDMAGQGFLRLLAELRAILLQDSVLLRREFPGQPRVLSRDLPEARLPGVRRPPGAIPDGQHDARGGPAPAGRSPGRGPSHRRPPGPPPGRRRAGPHDPGQTRGVEAKLATARTDIRRVQASIERLESKLDGLTSGRTTFTIRTFDPTFVVPTGQTADQVPLSRRPRLSSPRGRPPTRSPPPSRRPRPSPRGRPPSRSPRLRPRPSSQRGSCPSRRARPPTPSLSILHSLSCSSASGAPRQARRRPRCTRFPGPSTRSRSCGKNG
jgi:Centromere DNA-binding protein complex CBF3 subunit, domain 2